MARLAPRARTPRARAAGWPPVGSAAAGAAPGSGARRSARGAPPHTANLNRRAGSYKADAGPDRRVDAAGLRAEVVGLRPPARAEHDPERIWRASHLRCGAGELYSRVHSECPIRCRAHQAAGQVEGDVVRPLHEIRPAGVEHSVGPVGAKRTQRSDRARSYCSDWGVGTRQVLDHCCVSWSPSTNDFQYGWRC
jgi:hypothetical protein